MKNYIPADTATVLLLVLALAGAGSIYPVSVLLNEREQSQQILKETVQTIQRQLPDPSLSDFAKRIPLNINDNLRPGVRYYPQRDAYKYTFKQKYTYDHRGEILLDSGFPEPLERRSIWWKVIDGEWRCYAGVKKHIRGQLCNESAIIRGLTVSEHNNAWHLNNCSHIGIWLRSLNLAYNTHIYELINRSGKDGYARINAAGQEVLLILKSDGKQRDWHISYTPETKIRAVIWHNGGVKSAIYGLPPDLPVFDYVKARGQCHEKPDSGNKGIFTRNLTGIFDPTFRQETIYDESDSGIEIGGQENQPWQSSPTVVKGPFKTVNVVTVEADSKQNDDRILNKVPEE